MTRTIITYAAAAIVGFTSGWGAFDLVQGLATEAPAPIVLTENTADSPRDRAAFEDLRDDLLARGWYGIPGDGCECLYPPKD